MNNIDPKSNNWNWISVKDRLPEPGTKVWAYQPKYQMPLKFISETAWGPMWSESITSAYYGRVTHWMPLPEPPKPETV